MKHESYIGLSPIEVVVTTRILTFLVGDSKKLNLHLPLSLGRGTTQIIHNIQCSIILDIYIYIYLDCH